MNEAAPFPILTKTRPGYIISTDVTLLDVARIHEFLCYDAYWALGRTRDVVERSLQNSLCFGVYTNSQGTLGLVGFARAITDYSTYAYLADVFILPEYRGQGLGKWLVKTILAHPELQTLKRWTLYTRDAHELYRRFGFENERDPKRYMSFQKNNQNHQFGNVEE